MTDDSARVVVERDGAILRIGLNRPAKKNAADRALLSALAEAYTRLEHEDGVRVGLLYAEGDDFTAGLDLGDIGGDLASGGIDFRRDDQVDPWGLAGPPRTKPVVVAVHGLCLTLGIELILAADVAVATDSASFGQIEVARGILPFGGATARFPAAVGWGNAMRWMLTAERFDAAEALRIGLVQQVVRDGTELSTATAIAERIAAQAPLAVSAVLAASRAARAAAERDGLADVGGALARLTTSADAAEGVQAFHERRDPVWTGR
ncbi:crotonase/enoyl-CoA hydratase family protein [Amnibacterium endophyticum]|uniref:Crotonase/enoyl-CoA hydratase family protein n=1 Tax=Amnibacterium endophyticum TaxID=2109337 RepID=A0ABW4LEY6_9MICO